MDTKQERIKSFIERCKEVHKDKNYDYSLVAETYVNADTKVCIIDRDTKPDGTIYGPFYATPSNLLNGHGNAERKGELISKANIMTADEFFEKAKEVHKGENLDYSKAVYKGMREKILIIDHDKRPDGTEYGEYWQEGHAHIKGSGHPQKALDKRSKSQADGTAEFIRKATIANNGKYSYEKTVYVNTKTPVIVTCPIHGDFQTIPNNHVRGKGCPLCGRIRKKKEEQDTAK